MPRIRRVFDGVVNPMSRMGYGFLPKAIDDWKAIEVKRNVAYRPTGNRAHLLDIYRPRDAVRALPTVVYIHGGAFSMMSKDTHAMMAYVLASHGYQVFNLNYRLGPVHRYPKPLEDVITALIWILEKGREYGADIDRMCVMGESAGANLTLAMSYCAYHPRPEPFAKAIFERAPKFRCLAPLYGVLDLHDLERFWRDHQKSRRLAGWIKREIQATAFSYIGASPNAALEMPLASPLSLYEDPAPQGSRSLPPFFTSVGTADPLLSDTIRLKEALLERNTNCELHVFRGEIHAFNVMLWRKSAQEQWRALGRFLREHLEPDEAPAPKVGKKSDRYVSLRDMLLTG